MRRLPPPPPARPVWTIKAQVLESKPSDVRVMMGEWRDEPSLGSVAGEAGGCPPGDLRSGGVATSSRYGKSCCMWLHADIGGLKRGFGGQRGAGPDARCNVIAIRQMMLHLVAWRCTRAGRGGGFRGRLWNGKRRVRTAGLPRRRSNRSCAPCPTIACACRLGRTA